MELSATSRLRGASGLCGYHRESNVNAVPASTVELTSMVPPWASTISRAMYSPRPRLVDGRSWGSVWDFVICTSGLKITWSASGGIGSPLLRTSRRAVIRLVCEGQDNR